MVCVQEEDFARKRLVNSWVFVPLICKYSCKMVGFKPVIFKIKY